MRSAPLLVLLAGCGGLSVHATDVDGDGSLTPVDTTLVETDADADADADVDADTDADTDTTTPPTGPCDPPDVWDLGPQGPSAGTFTPIYVGVTMDGIVEGGQLLDVSFDGADASAWAVFTFYDGSFVPMCQVIFDASDAASPTADPAVQSGQILAESWSLSFSANQGHTTCPSMGGGVDPRQWVADRPWGISYGEMVELTASLRDAIDASAPGTWNSDWAPHVFAVFVDLGAPTAIEAGYIFSYDHDCYDVSSGTSPNPTPNGPIDAYVGYGGDWIVFTVDAL